MLVFGTRLRSFRNLTTSALTLLRSLVRLHTHMCAHHHAWRRACYSVA